MILRCHDEPPPMAAREALRLIDSEPVLDAELLALGRWIAGYYCAPLGEVLRGMLPLASEIRRGKVWSLTDSGRDAILMRQFQTFLLYGVTGSGKTEVYLTAIKAVLAQPGVSDV